MRTRVSLERHQPLVDATAFVRAVVAVVRSTNLTFIAGSLAYWAFITVVPLAALGVLALAVFGTEVLADRLLAYTDALLSREANTLLRRHLVGGAVTGTAGASALGLVTVLWGVFRLLGGIETAFAAIYGTTERRSFVASAVDAIVVLVTVPLAVVVVAVATTALALTNVAPLRLVSPLVLVCGLVVVFFPLYYVVPDTTVTVREVLPGVVFTAVGWVVLQQFFQVYVLVTGSSAGSVVGAVILFLTWLYVAGVVLLVGGVVNAVSGGHHERKRGTVDKQ